MKTAAGVAGGLALPTVLNSAWAQQKEYPALGNYPAGVSGDTVVAGLTLDLTGPIRLKAPVSAAASSWRPNCSTRVTRA